MTHNLPTAGSQLIGRESALEAVRATFDHARLVTLTGTGGSGKTRLMLALGHLLRDTYPDGAWWVELATLPTPELVPQAVAAVVGAREEAGTSLMDTLARTLQPRRTLLLLDNCEHLVAACAAVVQRLLESCPELRIVATSREPLDVPGEAVWQVPALSLPDPSARLTIESAHESNAVALFVERAIARRSGFQLSDDNVAAVVQICRGLDGLPLAIELAAARASVLSVAQIARRLDDRFRLLVSGPRTAPPRHQTLQATVDWSYDLLSPGEQAFFRCLSVFPGGFDLPAAQVVAPEAGEPREEALDLLDSLIDKSLVQMIVRDGEARYSLLETLREYGRERLRSRDELSPVMDGLAAHFLTLARTIRPRMGGQRQQAVLREIAVDHESYRAVMQWLEERQRWDDYLEVAAGVWNYWNLLGAVTEARFWLERGLRRPPRELHRPAARARALGCLGQTAWRQGENAEAQRLHEESLEIYRSLEDDGGTAWAQTNLGGVAYANGDLDAARLNWEEALIKQRALNQPRQIAILLNNLGLIADRERDLDRAVSLLEESAAIRRAIGDREGLASSLINLASLAHLRGDTIALRALAGEALELARDLGLRQHIGASLGTLALAEFREGRFAAAQERTEEALAIFTEIGYRPDQGGALAMLGCIATATGRLADARALHARSLTIRREQGNAFESADSLVGLARLALLLGRPARGAFLLGAVSAVIASASPPPGAEDAATVARAVRETIAPAAFAREHERGASATLDDVVDDALRWLDGTDSGSIDEQASADGGRAGLSRGAEQVPLSTREQQILQQLATGSSNKEIARDLHMSVRTVERHITNAYTKIGARGRADAIRYALGL